MKDNWIVIIMIALGVIIGTFLTSWANHDNNEQLHNKLEECRAEATAWHNATTALSDAIVFGALKGLPAENVDTNVATAFAVKGHELNCIQPKLPPG